MATSPQIQIATTSRGIQEIIIRVPRGGRGEGFRLLERVAVGLRLLDFQSRQAGDRAGGERGNHTDE